MNWLRKKHAAPELTEEQVILLKEQESQAAAFREIKIKWVRSAPMSEVMDDFVALIDEAKSVTSAPDNLAVRDIASYRKNWEGLDFCRTAWMRIDRSLVTDDEAVILYNILKYELTHFVGYYKTKVLTQPIFFALSGGYEHYVSSCYENIVNIQTAVNNRKLRQDVVSTSVVPVGHLFDQSLLPVFTAEVLGVLQRLEKLWLQANSKQNNVDDEFFLERTKDSYVPEALNLYKLFHTAPDDVKVQAEKLLLEQLGMIENHVLVIVKTQFEQNLKLLETQTVFIRSKVEPGQVSGSLQLLP